MNTTHRLVAWATDPEGGKQLLALDLLPEENQLRVHALKGPAATEDLFLSLQKDWGHRKTDALPEGMRTLSVPLTVSGDLLPEGMKAEDEGQLQKARHEWHFVVLSYKFYQNFLREWQELKERLDGSQDFDKGLWNDLKGFWDRVQVQINDKNLQKEHAQSLRTRTDELFTGLKNLRHQREKDLQARSEDAAQRFREELEKLENQIAEGKKLRAVFEKLKQLQREFHKAAFTRKHRNKIWKRLDAAFKAAKEKRFGAGSSQATSALERLQSRVQGLLGAIEKMESSIRRDRKSLDYENRKIQHSDGQLEAQIRQAKVQMIQERVNSKSAKLEDMLKTRAELEDRKKKLEEKVALEAERQKEREAKAREKEKARAAKRAQQLAQSIRARAIRSIVAFSHFRPEYHVHRVQKVVHSAEIETPLPSLDPMVSAILSICAFDAALRKTSLAQA